MFRKRLSLEDLLLLELEDCIDLARILVLVCFLSDGLARGPRFQVGAYKTFQKLQVHSFRNAELRLKFYRFQSSAIVYPKQKVPEECAQDYFFKNVITVVCNLIINLDRKVFLPSSHTKLIHDPYILPFVMQPAIIKTGCPTIKFQF